MLQMGPAAQNGDLQIRHTASRQHPRMIFLLQMGQNQPLPVPVQLVLAAQRTKSQPAPRLARLQKQLYFRVMAKGLEVTDADDRR